LNGSWSGSGKIFIDNGSSERIRCRGYYKVEGNGLNLNLRCASDSYKFELVSDISNEGGKLSGNWNETSHAVIGSLSGRMTSPGNIQAVASSIGFTATILISTRGNAQSVSIKSPGSEISEVTIALARAAK
jgi:hypothetical protein